MLETMEEKQKKDKGSDAVSIESGDGDDRESPESKDTTADDCIVDEDPSVDRKKELFKYNDTNYGINSDGDLADGVHEIFSPKAGTTTTNDAGDLFQEGKKDPLQLKGSNEVEDSFPDEEKHLGQLQISHIGSSHFREEGSIWQKHGDQTDILPVLDDDDIIAAADEADKAKGRSSFFSTEQEQPRASNKYKYNPDLELAVARIVPNEEDDEFIRKRDKKKKLEVATPAHEYNRDKIKNRKSFCRRYAILLMGCGILGIALIAVAVLMSRTVDKETNIKDSENSKTPSEPPSESTRETKILAYLKKEISTKVVLKGTPDFTAAAWILYEDPQQLDADDPQLAQRFALAVFYFSSTKNGLEPWNSCNPPSFSSEEAAFAASAGVDISNTTEKNSCTFMEREGIGNWSPVQNRTRWLSDSNECEWNGITCDQKKEVALIKLVGQKLSGNLDLRFEDEDDDCKNENDCNLLSRTLPGLQWLDVSYNELTGTVPPSFTNFPYLQGLELHGNNLRGEIPPSVFNLTSLQTLNLGENKLSGTLSTLIGRLSNLRGLHLHQNNFFGDFPTEIGKLSFLTYNRVHGNEFSGPLPTEIGNFKKIVNFSYGENAFSGTIPTQFGQLTDINHLLLHKNKLTGTIPSELFNMTKLKAFRLDQNRLTGTFPATELPRMESLTSFAVSNNELTGTIPTQLGAVSNLASAWLHMNEFSGEMPTEVCEAELKVLQTDCGPIDNPTVPCRCCTGCCDRSTGICEDS